MGVQVQWRTGVDPSDRARLEDRERFEKILQEAFALRPTVWIAKVVQEGPIENRVQFLVPNGKPYDPVIIPQMASAEDVRTLTAFLPEIKDKT